MGDRQLKKFWNKIPGCGYVPGGMFLSDLFLFSKNEIRIWKNKTEWTPGLTRKCVQQQFLAIFRY